MKLYQPPTMSQAEVKRGRPPIAQNPCKRARRDGSRGGVKGQAKRSRDPTKDLDFSHRGVCVVGGFMFTLNLLKSPLSTNKKPIYSATALFDADANVFDSSPQL